MAASRAAAPPVRHASPHASPERPMQDLAYLLLTAVFFGVAALAVRALERL
jgi:hypothetical protein